MVQLTTEERAAIDDLLECIAEAMSRLDEVDPAYANKTKLQKLLYLAIDEFDFRITYSWYLAGAIVPADTISPDGLRSAFDTLPGPETPSPSDQSEADIDAEISEVVDSRAASPHPTTESPEELVGADDVDAPQTPESGSEEETDSPIDPILFSSVASPDTGPESPSPMAIPGDRRDEVIDFYETLLPEVWKQNTMRFLQNFYLEYAPEPYRDLYVQSTHLRTRLNDIETVVESHIDGEQPQQSIADLVKEAGLDISDLHCSLRSSETLSATFDSFVRGTDLIEDGLMMLAQRNPEELTHDHLAATRAVQEFFYYYVWRYPCLLISKETATGPSAGALREERQHRFETFEAELDKKAEQFEHELADVGLLPDYTDYQVQGDEVDENISSLAGHYLK